VKTVKSIWKTLSLGITQCATRDWRSLYLWESFAWF